VVGRGLWWINEFGPCMWAGGEGREVGCSVFRPKREIVTGIFIFLNHIHNISYIYKFFVQK